MVQPRFEDKILSSEKIHSMRKNYEFWKKRIESIMAGDGYLSLRAWAGKPSTMAIIHFTDFRYGR
jgi:hypothetical protein